MTTITKMRHHITDLAFEKLCKNAQEIQEVTTLLTQIGVPWIEDHDPGASSLWKSLEHRANPTNETRAILNSQEDPSVRLGALLGFLLRKRLPDAIQSKGLITRIRDNKVCFCISGEVSLDDLNTLLEAPQSVLQD